MTQFQARNRIARLDYRLGCFGDSSVAGGLSPGPLHRKTQPILDRRGMEGQNRVVIPRVLRPPHLLTAYAHGAFPMAGEDGRIAWFAPDPRTIIPLQGYHVPRRLGRTLRQGRFDIAINRAFQEVMVACADRSEGTWISEEMLDAYVELHRLGFAHSLEVRREGQLVGGIYGVSLAGAFFGESMFHRVRDASKVALVSLLDRLASRGYVLFDVQFTTDHLLQFGAVEISRREFEGLLGQALGKEVTFA